MNTTLIGDIFEKRAFNLIQSLLNNGDFYLNGKNSIIFQKKEYYSERRKSNIKFDITVESYFSNAKQYSILNIFECKYLNKYVSVEDIEEFESKISQVGEHDTKGTIITNIGFSKSTVNIAKSLKIGLIKIKSNNDYEWINYRKDDSIQTIDFIENDTEPFIALVNNKVVTNFANYLKECKIIDYYKHNEKYINIPYLTEERIDEIVNRLYTYDIHNNYLLDTNKLCEFIATKYPVTFEFMDLSNDCLGKIEFEPMKITINNKLDENRMRFTLCHEIGHLILHNQLLKNKLDEKLDDDYTLSFKFSVTEKSSRRLELQANIFASYILLPIKPLNRMVGLFFEKERISKKYLYLDSQPVNQELAYNLLKILSQEFHVSKEAIKIRLISLGLLKDNTGFSLKKLIKDLTF